MKVNFEFDFAGTEDLAAQLRAAADMFSPAADKPVPAEKPAPVKGKAKKAAEPVEETEEAETEETSEVEAKAIIEKAKIKLSAVYGNAAGKALVDKLLKKYSIKNFNFVPLERALEFKMDVETGTRDIKA